MDMSNLLRLLPTMEMIAEELSLAGWAFHASIPEKNHVYHGVRLFTGQKELQSDILYTLRPGETNFPTDTHAYICTTPITGAANHIRCPDQSPEMVLDFLLELFSRYQQKEQMIDQLVYRSASLQELCELGASLLGNPVCIHDDWFIMIGMSREVEHVMAPEYIMSSTKGFIPRIILDDFKYDNEYLETYAHPNAQIWPAADDGPISLYVNLWDGTIYRGRLLVLQYNRPFRESDFILAEVLTQRANHLLQRKQLGESPQYRSMDDIVFALLEGKLSDPADLSHLLNMLSWSKSDHYLCMRLRSQASGRNTVMEHMLHSDLFRIFPGSYIMFSGREQCLVLNLTQKAVSASQIHQQLAPLCRDCCLYAGISSPVSGIQELYLAYFQAGIALEQAFHLHSDKWILSFSQCALDHVMSNLNSPLTAWHLVSPGLRTLMEFDKEKGTQYFETFREYLLKERDIPRTAEKLIIHRTTLLYRLKKIQSMISVNLDDPWQRLYLTMSLWILEKEGNRTL